MSLINALNQNFDHIFVLTLERAKDRQQAFKKRFQGLNYTFFNGIDGHELDYEQLIKDGTYSEQKAVEASRYHFKMTKGHIACSLGHVLIYQEAIKKNYDRLLILEDDAVLNEHVENDLLDKAMNELPPDWELLYLGYDKNENPGPVIPAKQLFYSLLSITGYLPWSMKRVWNIYPQPYSAYLMKSGDHVLTHAYAISLKAAKVMAQLHQPVFLNADHLLAHFATNELGKSFILKDKMFVQDDVTSIITSVG